jgi:ribonuclease HI
MWLDITYVPQTTIKSQALVDFMMEWTETQQPRAPVTQEHWSMYFNVSSTLNGVGRGVVLISPKGDRLLYMIWLYFCATNNVAEYEALVNGLRITIVLGVQRLYIREDSELVVNQVMGESNCRDPCMTAYHQEVRKLEDKFDGFKPHYILWHDNEAADTLTWLGSSHEHPPLGVFIQDLIKSSIRFDEDDPTPTPGTQTDEGDPTPTSGTDPGTPPGPAGQGWEPGSEVAIVIEPSGSDPD